MELHESAAQRAAILHGEGPAEVIAGPGSGKTWVITHRLKYLIDTLHIPPGNILTITYTRSAATGMKERAAYLLKEKVSELSFGTFHSIFFSILKKRFHLSSEQILKANDKCLIFDEIRSALKQDLFDAPEFMSLLAPEISRAKNAGYGSDCESSLLSKEEFSEACSLYDRKLKEYGKIDFDDMLLQCRKLLLEEEKTLRFWQDQYRFIQIDEFQDISPVQYEIIRLLSAKEQNLFVVGDDDQAIYGFRGAEPSIMRSFQNDYPGLSLYYLTENYRSCGSIVKGASLVIAGNRDRIEKQFIPKASVGDPVRILGYRDRNEEISDMIRLIQERVKEGASFRDFAVLLRTNSLSGFFAEAFSQSGIPYRSREEIRDLYSSMPGSDIMNYLEFASGNRSRELFYKIMNRPVRYISREAAGSEEFSFEKLKRYYRNRDLLLQRVEALEWDIKRLSVLKPYAAVHYLLYGMGYLEYLRDYAAEHRNDPERLEELALETMERARGYGDYASWKKAVSLSRQQAKDESGDRVHILTMHAAKGLEYEEVFLPELNEGIIPGRRAGTESEIEEERRLFYVAMTRARKRLYLSYIEEHYGKKLQPSRFLLSLEEQEKGKTTG